MHQGQMREIKTYRHVTQPLTTFQYFLTHNWELCQAGAVNSTSYKWQLYFYSQLAYCTMDLEKEIKGCLVAGLSLQ